MGRKTNQGRARVENCKKTRHTRLRKSQESDSTSQNTPNAATEVSEDMQGIEQVCQQLFTPAIDTGFQSMHVDSVPPLAVVDSGEMPSRDDLVDNQHSVQLHQQNHDGMECDEGNGSGEGDFHDAGNEDNSGNTGSQRVAPQRVRMR